jgi:hypothetical protein
VFLFDYFIFRVDFQTQLHLQNLLNDTVLQYYNKQYFLSILNLVFFEYHGYSQVSRSIRSGVIGVSENRSRFEILMVKP